MCGARHCRFVPHIAAAFTPFQDEDVAVARPNRQRHGGDCVPRTKMGAQGAAGDGESSAAYGVEDDTVREHGPGNGRRARVPQGGERHWQRRCRHRVPLRDAGRHGGGRQAPARPRPPRPRLPGRGDHARWHPAPQRRAAARLRVQRGGQPAPVRVHADGVAGRGPARRQRRAPPELGRQAPRRHRGGARAMLPAPRVLAEDPAPRRQVQQHPAGLGDGGARRRLRPRQVPQPRRVLLRRHEGGGGGGVLVRRRRHVRVHRSW